MVIERALHHGYTHHIERLMVLSNFCLLAGITPQEVNEWFTACYIDAYDWVMLPNLLALGRIGIEERQLIQNQAGEWIRS